MDVGIIIGQDAYDLKKTLGLKDNNTKAIFRRSNRVRMGSQWTHDGQETKNCCHFVFTKDVKVAEIIQKWLDIEIYSSKINVASQSKKDLQAQKMLEITTNFTGERYQMGML